MYKVPYLILVYKYLNSVFMLTDKGKMVVAIGGEKKINVEVVVI